MTRLRLRPALRRAMIAHARCDLPRECCGFLIGAGRAVACIAPMSNIDESAVRYRIDDRAHIELRRIVRGFVPAMSILGVYHSHPNGPAAPSPSDIAEALYPDWVHVIVGLGGGRPRVRAFRIQDGRVAPVVLG